MSRKSNNLSFLKYFIAMLATLLVAACSTAENTPEVNFGHAPHDHHAALYIAASRPEFFIKHGGIYLKEIKYHQRYALYDQDALLARITISSSTGGGQLIRKLVERQLDVCMGGVPAMIQAIDSGNPLCILMPLMTGGAGLMLSKDIPATNWADFISYLSQVKEPVRIGYKTASSVQNLILEQALTFENVPFSHSLSSKNTPVVLINMYGPGNLIPGMRNGLIDGFVIMEPYLTLAQRELGARMVCSLDKLPPEGQWSEFPCCALAAVDRKFVSEHYIVMVALIRLIQRAHTYIHDHPEDASKVVAKWLDKPEEIERVSLPSIHFMNDFSPAWRAGVRSWIRSLVNSGKLTGRVARADQYGNIENILYDFRPLKEANRGDS